MPGDTKQNVTDDASALKKKRVKMETDNDNWICTSQSTNKTALVVEEAPGHVDPQNPRFGKERPQRIQCMVQALKDSPDCLWDKCLLLSSTLLPKEEEIETILTRVHRPAYLQRWNRLTAKRLSQEQWNQEAEQFDTLFLTPDSLQAAKRAAMSLCQLVAAVLCGHVDNGLALIRPPGHHAHACLAGGYCLINNVAVAAHYALSLQQQQQQQRQQQPIPKVLIVDWDIHHGDGTQAAFYDNPQVLYISVHRRGGPDFFPSSATTTTTGSGGDCSQVGYGRGMGRNVNVAWSCRGMGDDEYHCVWQTLVIPMAREFQPDLILISAGFDGVEGDLGECCVSPACFYTLTRQLRQVCPRVVASLEGGYVPSALGACAQQVVRALLSANHDENDDDNEALRTDSPLLGRSIHPVAAQDIQATIQAHLPYWKCLQKKLDKDKDKDDTVISSKPPNKSFCQPCGC